MDVLEKEAAGQARCRRAREGAFHSVRGARASDPIEGQVCDGDR